MKGLRLSGSLFQPTCSVTVSAPGEALGSAASAPPSPQTRPAASTQSVVATIRRTAARRRTPGVRWPPDGVTECVMKSPLLSPHGDLEPPHTTPVTGRAGREALVPPRDRTSLDPQPVYTVIPRAHRRRKRPAASASCARAGSLCILAADPSWSGPGAAPVPLSLPCP